VAANGNSIIQDLNSDGSLDIAVVNATDSSFELFLGNGDGTFDASVSYTTPETDARGIAAGDFNLDGAFDIAVSLNENGFAIFEQGVSADTIGSAVRELAPMSIATVSTARETLTKIEREKENISCAIVAYGAFQNRVAVAITHLRSLTENIRAAESQITSVDVAQEAAELVRKNILMQAGMAVLAQANKQPQIALKLLEEI
jgi:flagellin